MFCHVRPRKSTTPLDLGIFSLILSSHYNNNNKIFKNIEGMVCGIWPLPCPFPAWVDYFIFSFNAWLWFQECVLTWRALMPRYVFVSILCSPFSPLLLFVWASISIIPRLPFFSFFAFLFFPSLIPISPSSTKPWRGHVFRKPLIN